MSQLLSREYEVNFSHIDNRGIARPSFLFDVMQDAATVHAEQLQLSRQALRVIWVLSRIRVTLCRPLLPYERIRCETWCPGIRGASWYRSFSFFAGDREIGAAQSMWVTLDPVTHRIVRPTAFPAAQRWMHGDSSELLAPLCKLSCASTRLHHMHTVRYSDLDINDHVNNVKVVDFIADALDLQKQPGYVCALQVNYTAETHLVSSLPCSAAPLIPCDLCAERWTVRHTLKRLPRSHRCPFKEELCMNPVDQLICDICHACVPLRIVQYAEKRTLSTNKLKALSLCVIVRSGDPREVRRKLHLALSAELPITLSVYTAAQWQSLMADPSSFAAWISQKGQVLYEQKT